MTKILLLSLTLLLVVCAGAQAQTTTMNISGTLTIGATFSFTGTATLTGAISGSGQMTIPSLTPGASGFTGAFTIALTGGNLTGTVTVPSTIVAGTGNISLTVTGGTGSYANATSPAISLSNGTATVGTSISLSNYTGTGTITIGGGGTGPGPGTNTPTVTAVLDAASYTKNIAQGSIFVVKGTNLSAAGFTQFSFPLPTTSTTGNVKITFTPAAGGAGTDAYLVYLYNQSNVNQLAAILPSTVAAGNYNVTVSSAGATSAPFAVSVVQRKPGIITQDSSGSGLAVVQNYISASQLDVDRFTTQTISGVTVSPAKPGQVLIAWLTGMGAVSGGDNTASPGYDFSANGVDVQVMVAGTRIKPLYAGRAPGLAGADQINFTLPSNITTGCVVPLQVSVGGQLSQTTFISIAPTPSDTACVDPNYTLSQLQAFDQGNSYTVGYFTLSQIAESFQGQNVKINAAGGAFTKITGFQLSSASQYQASATNACQVIHVNGSSSQIGVPVSATNLDAGTITLSGPSGSNLTNLALTKDANTKAYSASLGMEGLGVTIPGQTNATLVAGQYTLKGAGGPDVGAFTANVTLGSPLTITGGLPATVVRANGLPLAWTGGNSTDIVQIIGYAGTVTGTGANAVTDATEFICTTTAGRGGFTVPADILNQLPAVTAAQISANTAVGALQVFSSVNPTDGNGKFNAPLTAGGNIQAGYFLGSIGIGAFPAFQ